MERKGGEEEKVNEVNESLVFWKQGSIKFFKEPVFLVSYGASSEVLTHVCIAQLPAYAPLCTS